MDAVKGDHLDICIILSLFLAMYQTHLDTPANQARIAEGGKHLEAQCETFKAEQEKKNKKVGKETIKPKK